ncbi:MAG: hypothetical protein ACREC6_06270, partial [Hyphomicrobiaceae bacterium]
METIETTDRPRGSSGLLRLYMATWAVLGALALMYLAALVVRPDLIAELFPASGPSQAEEEEAAQLRRTVTRLASDLQSLRQSVVDLHRDGELVKTAAGEQTGLHGRIGERLTVLENQIGRLAVDVNRLELFRAASVAETGTAAKAPRKAADAGQSKSAVVTG